MLIYEILNTIKGYSPLKKEDKEEISADELQDKYGVSLIAHRGSDRAPENTLSAFQMAYDENYQAFECDVSWSKDEVPVMLHDETINRTAQRNSIFSFLIFPKKCSKLNYEDLLKYDFGSSFNKDFKGEKIPTFDETIECVKENDGSIYIELKKDFDSDKAKILTDIIEENNLNDNVTWISFEQDYLKEISDLIPEARLGYLTSDAVDSDTIDILDELKNNENEVFLDIKSSKINQKALDLLEEADYSFEAWTVDDIKEFERLYSLGCRGFTTDKLTTDDIVEYFNSK